MAYRLPEFVASLLSYGQKNDPVTPLFRESPPIILTFHSHLILCARQNVGINASLVLYLECYVCRRNFHFPFAHRSLANAFRRILHVEETPADNNMNKFSFERDDRIFL
jgi:hypothetical protein